MSPSTPATRLAMTSRHLSTPAAAEPSVLFEAVHSLRKVTLNRPKALNALNEDMVSLLQPQLQASGPPRPAARQRES